MKKISFMVLFLLLVVIASGCVNPFVKEELSIDGEKLVAHFINDSKCITENCDANFVEGVKGSLMQLLPNLEFVDYDYDSNLGSQLYKEYELTVLPALLFTKKVEAEAGYANLQNYLTPKGDLLDLKLGATFNPTTGLHSVEFCSNEVDDNGDDLSDCEDPSCAGNLVCNTEAPNKLDLFVMSECPYGTKALDAMKEVLENFDGAVDFNVHFIARENEDGSFQSLHGQTEVDENARELCAIENYPTDYKYMEYVWCRDTDLTADWGECVEDFPEVASCFESGEGYELLSENIKLGNKLGISASPTWIANDRYQFSGIDANTIKNNICKYNPGLEGCENELSTTAAPAGACN
jgi:hypothetical protein